LSTFSYPAFKAKIDSDLICDFKCPSCGSALQAGSGSAEKTYSCDNNHCFDMAKEGYLNLHLAQHKRSRNPGDSDEMIRSRQRFLNAGHYQDLAEALTDAIKQNGRDHRLLDIGCGEGYYLAEIHKTWPELQLVGLDISKTAVRLAAKRKLNAQLAVDSGFNMALFDNSVDTAISVFSPISAGETSRVLKPEGQLIMVGPGAQHLSGLTAHIYDQSTAHGGNYQVLDNSSEFSLLTETTIEKDICVEGSAIADLLHMTPYYWHAKPQQQKYLAELDQLETKIQFTLRVYSNRAGKP
jgi:23S rRNA (guanine745-N1)-methyltransferase